MVDDATSATQALLFDEETTEAALRILWHWIDLYGVPQALYTDKRIVYVTSREPTIEEQLAGKKPLTAFGLACKKLGIDIITAHSPQAKGRVERSNAVYQVRLVKELRFQKIKTRKEANRLLKNEFCQQLNDKFACEPAKRKNGHRKLKNSEHLYHILCWEEKRKLNNDWTIRFKNQFYQIDKSHTRLIKPKMKLTVRTYLDKEIAILYKEKTLKFQPIAHRPDKPKKPLLPQQNISEMKRQASAQSPWRQFNPGWLKENAQPKPAQNKVNQGRF